MPDSTLLQMPSGPLSKSENPKLMDILSRLADMVKVHKRTEVQK